MKVCLPPKIVDSFRGALTSGKIDPAKLAQMTSDERHSFFTDLVGKDFAEFTNSTFESKLLLKNQQAGYISWAKKVAGITPEVRRDLVSRIEKLDKVLNPAESEQFLKDLAATKLGVGVSEAEAKQVATLSQQITKLKEKQRPDGTFLNDADRLAYGRAKVDLGSYVSDLKHEANKTSLKTLAMHPAKAATSAASLSKSLKASLDNSAIFRQGWKTMFTNPKEWAKNSAKTWQDAAKEFRGKDAMREVTADIVSRPNYDLYQKAKLATSTIEEAFPSQLPEKIPIFGRAFKASEAAYTGFLHRQRADIFDKYVDIAKKQGVDLTDKTQLESMGKMVNALTGRGHLGGLEPSANTVNSVFFSPRSVKANIDTLTAHSFQKGVTPFVRKEAAKNLVKVIAGTASVMAIANLVKPGSVELDPRSSDFGKIKIGNTRFDVTGGMNSITTLAARLLTQSTKSTSGGVKKLNSGYGSQSGIDVISNFMENKLSPAASVVKEVFINHKDFNGNPVTVKGELGNAFTPLPITNATELLHFKNGANALVGSLADAFGIATNTYSSSTKDWSQQPTKELQQFKDKFGAGKLKEANDKYNQAYDDWYNGKKEVANLPELKDLPKSQWPDMVTRAKQDIQDYVLHQYGFKYEKSQAEKDASKAKAKETRDRKKARGY